MKIIGIGGAPTTGKTTLMRAILEELDKKAGWKPFNYGLVRGRVYSDIQTVILGIYDNTLFSGTDRLSMGVAPDFKKWVKLMQMKYLNGMKVLFEGDRLFSQTIIETIKEVGAESKFIVLKATDETRAKRKIDRADTQSEQFMKGRVTKYNRIVEAGLAETRPHEIPEHTLALRDEVMSFLSA